MEIDFVVNEDCKECKKSLKYLKKLYKRNKNAYANFILYPIKKYIIRNRDLGEEDRIRGVLLRPDYNSEGHLTHFHISEEENLRKQFGEELKKEMNKLLIQQNTLWGQALLDRKDTGKTVEHCFDGFFRNMQNETKEIIDKLVGNEE